MKIMHSAAMLAASLVAVAIATAPASAASVSVYTSTAPWHPAGYNLYGVPTDADNHTGSGAAPVSGHAESKGVDPIWAGAPVIVYADAQAAADLATGKLGAYSETNLYGQSQATASFFDVLTLNVPGATGDAFTTVRFNFSYDGIVDVEEQGFARSWLDLTIYQVNIYAGQEFARVIQRHDSLNGSTSDKSGWDDILIDVVGNQTKITADYVFRGAAPMIGISMSLGTQTVGPAIADFSHTATVRLDLPPGVTFTSESGVFLSQAQDTDVPEPAALGLLGLGILGIAGLRRRKA